MPSKISDIETTVRLRLIEPTPRFWTSAELTDIIITGIRDLWRDIVDLKQEHFLTINNSDVYFDINSTTLRGIPTDVHKVYLIEPRDLSVNASTSGLKFTPMDYNHRYFQSARASAAIDPCADEIFYCITSQGTPVNSPVIYCAPKVTSQVPISFCYIPSVGDLNTNSTVPIPGEANNALVAWTVAFAKAKENDAQSPDPNWLAIYSTEKQHLLQSLGMREYQEAQYVQAEFEEYT